jgi:polysaccharide lyase-like protein
MPVNASKAALLASFALLMGIFLSTAVQPAPAAAKKRQHASIGLSDNVGLLAKHAKQAKQNVNKPMRKAALPTPNPDLIFDGSTIADFDLLQAAPGAITEVADPAGSGTSSFRMNVSDRDVAPVTPTDNPRAQALSPPIIDNGDEFWLQTKFMLPAEMPKVDGWMSLVSIYGAPFRGSSPWQIEVAGDKLQWMRNDTYDWDVPWSMPLVKGRWVTVLLHERFASDGWVEMWVDGQPVKFFGSQTRLSMQTMDSSNNGGANSAKIMQYRERGMFDTASVYFGPLRVGTTRESVSV